MYTYQVPCLAQLFNCSLKQIFNNPITWQQISVFGHGSMFETTCSSSKWRFRIEKKMIYEALGFTENSLKTKTTQITTSKSISDNVNQQKTAPAVTSLSRTGSEASHILTHPEDCKITVNGMLSWHTLSPFVPELLLIMFIPLWPVYPSSNECFQDDSMSQSVL